MLAVEFIKKRKKLCLVVSVAGLLFLFALFFITSIQIGNNVKKNCQTAQQKYGGVCVEALMSWVSDDSTDIGKNEAIWTLGQLGDKNAISFLESYDNGQKINEKESWDRGISQYELRKAVKLLKSDFNITALVWRR